MNSNKISYVKTPKEVANLMVKLSTIPKDGLILDSGCGDGVFLEELKREGYKNCLGIEIDEELYKVCVSKNLNVMLGDFLTYGFKEKFDLIIGNPPYAHFNQLPKQVADNVKRIIKTAEGDIYYAFIIKAINLLKENGELIYIVPYHFFYNTYAKTVREYILKNGKLELIIDLDEVKIFKGENPETVIFKFRKGSFNLSEERIKVLNIKTRKISISQMCETLFDALKSETSNYVWAYKEIPHFKTADGWSSLYSEIPDFPFVKLKDIAKVGVGLVSGYDKAFLISEKEYLSLNEKEKSLIKKFVKAKNCRRFVVDGYSYYILIDDKINNEDDLKNEYPSIYEKLSRYKNEMEKRYLPQGKSWFNWMALRNYNFLVSNLNKKRIYVPVLDRRPYNRFSLGEENLLPSGDVVFIQPYNQDDVWFLLGFLNSTFFRNYYLSNGGRRGGRVAFTQKLLEQAKIPLFSAEIKNKIKEIVIEIIHRLGKGKEIANLENEIERLISKSFELKMFEYSKLF